MYRTIQDSILLSLALSNSAMRVVGNANFMNCSSFFISLSFNLDLISNVEIKGTIEVISKLIFDMRLVLLEYLGFVEHISNRSI